MTDAEIKRELRKARRRERALGRAINRLRKLREFAAGAHLHGLRKWAGKRIDGTQETLKATRERIKALEDRLEPDVPGESGGWHAGAIRNQEQPGIGAPLNVPGKIVWHTTEGSSLPPYSGSHPHFTIDLEERRLYQHVSIRSMAYALRNLAGGAETNRANAIQVEIIGFAGRSHLWPDSHYEQLAALARWIEKYAGVRRACSVRFGGAGNLPARLGAAAWNAYAGHIGHQHVPEQDHWDPGALQIGKII